MEWDERGENGWKGREISDKSSYGARFTNANIPLALMTFEASSVCRAKISKERTIADVWQIVWSRPQHPRSLVPAGGLAGRSSERRSVAPLPKRRQVTQHNEDTQEHVRSYPGI